MLFMQEMVKSLKRILKFRPSTVTGVAQRFREVRQKVKKRFPDRDPSKTIFVAIHSRRTDYVKFAWDKFGIVPMEEEYFQKAMQYFR